jgi:hypothetical protein
MSQTLKEAITLIEGGRELQRVCVLLACIAHLAVCSFRVSDVRVGPETISDPAFLVSR